MILEQEPDTSTLGYLKRRLMIVGAGAGLINRENTENSKISGKFRNVSDTM
jgi:hypothetical protein